MFFFPAQQPVGFLLWQTAVCVVQGGASPRAYAVLWKWSGANCQVWQKTLIIFDPLTYFCLNEMWGSENTKKRINSAQRWNSIWGNCLLIDHRGGSPPLPVTVLVSFVLQFLDKVEVCLCLDQCLLNPLNYSLAYLSSWNLRKQISIQRMTLHLPPALFCCFQARWVASCEGTWWPTIR